MEKLPTPQEIRAHLDEYVVGQEDAKKVISVAVYNHYKRIKFTDTSDDIEIKKSNIMMIGPTGSGKTYLATTLAKKLGVPIAMADATVMITSNNINREIENMLHELLKISDYNVERAKSGIIFIDEVDKLVAGINRAKGEGIQQALLKIIEGTVANVNVGDRVIPFDTKDVLFIAGGAFVALAMIIQLRLADTRAGLLTETELVKKCETEDLAKFGLIPEFVGRLPTIVSLEALQIAELRNILTEPKNAIASQFKKMFSIDGIELRFEENALNLIAEMAYKLKTGARGLRTIMEKSMREIMYTMPSEKNVLRVIITREVIENNAPPIIERVTAEAGIELAPLEPKRPRGEWAHAD